MKHLTNMYNPDLPDFKDHIIRKSGESIQETVEALHKYLSDKTIGLPQETPFSTTEELVDMNIIGVYKNE